jgi:RHS repeat-associated protein
MYDCGQPAPNECVCQQPDQYNSIWEFSTLGECLEESEEEEEIINALYEDNYLLCYGELPLPSFCPFGGASGSFDQNGGNYFSKNLINLPSHGLSPFFSVHYNSQYNKDRGLGVGWSHTYLYSLSEGTNGRVLITNDRGFRRLYKPAGGGTYLSTSDDYAVLTKSGTTFYATQKDGIKYRYNIISTDSGSKYVLDRIEDLNGNALTLSYNTKGNLIKVKEANYTSGRELNFSYNVTTNLLESVTDPNSNQWTFSYQANKLVVIQFPDDNQSQYRFEYFDYNNPPNLTRVADKNDNTLKLFQYDDHDQLIEENSGDGKGLITIEYAPAALTFSDDFEDGINTEEWETTGSVTRAVDPSENNYVAHINSGSMTYKKQQPSESLKTTFNLWVVTQSQDYFVKVYDRALGENYGAWLRFISTSTTKFKIQTEFKIDGNTYIKDIKTGLDKGKWHKVEIETDARDGYEYFRVWINCEYLGGYFLKQSTTGFDTVSIQGGPNNIYIDNFSLEEVSVSGGKRTITNSRGNTTVLTITSPNAFGGKSYQMVGGCASCSQSSSSMLYEYDSRWNLRRTIDGNDVKTEMSYNVDRGIMLTKTEAKGTVLERTTTYTYHPRFNKVQTRTEESVDAAGRNKITTYTYDETNGNLLEETVTGYSNGTSFIYTTAYQYNTHGQVIEIDGPRNNTINDVTAYTYHPTYGYLTSVTYPNGTLTYDSYDANHNVGSMIDLNGVTTTYTYDYADRVKTITVGSAVTTYAYDALGNIDYATLPAGNRIDYEYDTSNRVIKITDALGSYIYYEYDGEGNKTREEIRDDQGVIKKYLDFEYDQFNRINKIKNPDNSSTGFSYDNNGNRIQMIKPEGEINEYESDELSRLKKITQSKGTSEEAITEYEYDLQDNLTQVKDAEGKVTRYSYDDMGRLISTVSPDAGTTSYLYDEAGNIKTRTDAKGMVTGFEYDALNRLVKLDFPTDQDITYTYDETGVPYGIGRLTTMADASGNTRYSYDERGNVTEQSCTIEGRTFSTGYEYNLNNVAKKISYPGGIVVEYGLDSTGKITSTILNGNTIVSEVAYEPFGELKSMSFAQSGIGTTITHNNQYQINEIQSENVLHRTYTHDFDGNITYIQRSDSLPLPQVYTGADNYSYAAGKDWIDGINDGTHSYQYTYDPNGNIISDGRFTYQYNENNQLVKVSDTSTVLGEYTYNGKGQRVKKVADGRTTIYHYDLTGNLIQETDQNGGVIAGYIYAGTNRLAMLKPDGSIYYYHNDHLGTPLAMTDTEGNIVWKATYDPFGRAEVAPTSTVTNNFRFPGQYYDEESGLHYNWYRYYDPRTGRYMTPDPIGIKRGENHLYVYVQNNPTNFIDPLGLDSPGCDLGRLGKYVTPCMLECCAQHDKCYDDNKCTASSWNPCGRFQPNDCDKCNFDAGQCFANCGLNQYDDPNKPNYYCRNQQRFINIPGDFPDLESAIRACSNDF